jgi:hypothetical protein
MPFVKLDCKILYSSIWAESAEISKVWITLLAMANSDGLVESTAPGIARLSVVSLDEAKRALEVFESPDIESKNKNNDGRRIKRVDGGYLILNYCQYREKDHTAAARMKKYREKLRSNVTSRNDCSASEYASEYTNKENTIKLTSYFLSTMSEDFRKKFKDHVKWNICFEKLLNEFEFDKLMVWIRYYRQDEFWAKNFLSPLKLLKKNKEGMRYIDYFVERLKQNPIGNKEQKIDYRTVGTADEFAADKADIERRKARALTEKNRGETNG